MAEQRTILVVDDDHELVDGLRAVLEQQGFKVIQARDGQQGKQQIYAQRPDLVIIDMMMPRVGGYPVLEHFRGKTDAPPFIMITANEGSRHKAYAEYLGVIDYIRKPFAMERLLEGIDQAFRPLPPTLESAVAPPFAPLPQPVEARGLKKKPGRHDGVPSAAEEVGDFCHKFKTHLTSIKMWLYLDPPDLDQALSIVRTAGAQLSEIHHIVRRLYRPAARPPTMRATPVRRRLPAAISEVVGVFCHDLRSRLAALSLWLSAGESDPVHGCRLVDAAGEAVADLHQLVRTYYRVEADPATEVIGPAVAICLRDIVQPTGGPSEAARIDAGGLPRSFRIPRVLLRLLVVPLVENAFEAISSRPGVLSITVAKPRGENSLIIEVSDTGPGWPGGAVRAGQRLDGEEFFTTKGVGRGRGLVNLRRLVDKLGGRLELADVPNGGAISRIVLPW